MKQLSHIWFIMLKDLKLFTRDRMALGFFLLFPMLFITVFNFMMSEVPLDNRLVLHVATQEAEGGLSRQIIEAMETGDDSELGPGEPQIVWLRDYDEARRKLEDGEMSSFLSFPADFTERVYAGSGANLEVVIDLEDTRASAALGGLAGLISAQISSQQVATSAVVQLMIMEGLLDPGDQAAIDEVVERVVSGEGEGTTEGPAVRFEIESVGDVEAENAANYVIPGYLVMFVFFAAALAAEVIVRERQNNTLERLMASSVSRVALLGGMFAGTAAKGLIQVAVFWIVGLLAFKIDLGLSPAAVIILSVLMVIMSAAFGIMLATLVKTQRSAGSIAVLMALIMAPLGGCWWPLFVTPSWMQFLAKLTPHGWANTGFNKLMVFGAEFGDVIPEMLALVCFAVVFGIIGIWRFRTAAA